MGLKQLLTNGAWISVDYFVPLWVWFLIGFTMVSVLFGILNFAMNIVIMVTVKGFFIPTWALVVITVVIVVFCTILGYLFERHNIQNKILNHQNINQNPQIKQISEDVMDMKKVVANLEKMITILAEKNNGE